jgi:hypothetical protein
MRGIYHCLAAVMATVFLLPAHAEELELVEITAMLSHGLPEAELTAKLAENGVSFEVTTRTVEVLLEYGASCAVLEAVMVDIPAATRARWNSKPLKQACPALLGIRSLAEGETAVFQYISEEVVEVDSLARVMCGALHEDYVGRRIRVEAEFVQMGRGNQSSNVQLDYYPGRVYFQVLPVGYFSRGAASFEDQRLYQVLVDPENADAVFSLLPGDRVVLEGRVSRSMTKLLSVSLTGLSDDPEWIVFRAHGVSHP